MRSGSSAMSESPWPVCSVTISNMWVFFVTLLIAVPITAVKESELIHSIPAKDRKLLFQLVKRLQDEKSLGQPNWNEAPQPKCEISPNRNSIIKRKDSENNGAKNLGYFKDVASNDACAELCCKNESCDLAVYENKDDRYCYLFHCEGNCVFSHHSSYLSTDVSRRRQTTPGTYNSEQNLREPNTAEEEEDEEDIVRDREPPAPSPTEPAVASTLASQFIRAHSVGLDGFCRQDRHCEDPHAECSSRKCVCEDGYYRKGPICREVCAPSNFACLGLGTIGLGPHCVDSSKVCDGTTQCADGSDEINCPDAGPAPLRPWQQEAAHSHSQPQSQPQQPAYPQQSAAPQTSQAQQPQPAPQTRQQVQQPQQSAGSAPNSYAGTQYSDKSLSQPQDGVRVDLDTAHSYQQTDQEPGPSQQYQQQQQQANLGPSHGYPAYDQVPAGNKQPQPNTQPAASGHEAYNRVDQEQDLAQGNRPHITSAPQQQVAAGSKKPAASQNVESQSVSHSANSQQRYQSEESELAHPSSGSQQAYETGQVQQGYPTGSQKAYQQAGSQQARPSATYVPAAGSQAQQPQGPQQGYPSQGAQQNYQDTGSQAQQGYLSQGQQKYQQPARRPQDSDRRPQTGHDVLESLPPQAASHRQQTNSDMYQEAGLLDENRLPQQPMQQQPVQQSYPQERPQTSHSQSQPQQAQQAVNLPSQSRSGSGSSSDYMATTHPPHDRVEGALGPNSAKPKTHLETELQKPSVGSGTKIDPKKTYVVPGHSIVNQPTESKGVGVPEKPHSHSAYDVRVGAHKTSSKTSLKQKPGLKQKTYQHPSELDPQPSPQYFSPFGDQYLQQSPYGHQYPNSYTGYQNYIPGSNSQGSGYQGFADQYYPGQGQRGYPQQGYLGLQDLGYPSQYSPPHYEFGEFDPAYTETDSFPSSHDMPVYQPKYKPDVKSESKSEAGKSSAGSAPVSAEKSASHEDTPDEDRKHETVEKEPAADKSSESKEPPKPADTDTKPAETSKTSGEAQSKSQDQDKTDKGQIIEDDDDSKSSDKSSSNDNSASADKDKDTKQDTKAGQALSDQDEFISRAKLDFDAESVSMQGPIIALSLGLAFTFILLVFVACRLRTVRRRLRKGRPLHSNEADYLINGMYL